MRFPAYALLVPAFVVLSGARALAGLAEATDYDGIWTIGSESHSAPVPTPVYWVAQSGTSLDGVDAAEGRLGGADLTWIETTVTGPTTLYFSYNAVNFSGSYGGSFTLILNGGPPDTLVSFPGYGPIITTGWRESSIAIPDGSATVRWQLSWFRGVTDGRAYVDQVWTSDDPRPRITSTQATGKFNTPLNWTVPVASATPATLTASGLPPGLTVDSTSHLVSGTPTAAGTFEATMTAQNAVGTHIAKVIFDIAPGSTTIPVGVDLPAQVFNQTGPGAPWSGVTGFGHAGEDCARAAGSNTPSVQDSVILSTTFTGPGTLSFWYFNEGQANDPFADHALINFFLGIPPSSSQQTLQLAATNAWTKVSVPVPAGRQTVSWIALRAEAYNYGAPVRYAYLDEMAFDPGVPEIAVETEPVASNIPDGGSRHFGTVFVTSATSLGFTIRNAGPGNLTGLTTTIDGADAADFALSLPPTAPVGPGGTTSLTVQFAPVSAGSKTAVLHIANNDSDENPFDITLTGEATGITSQPVSRVVDPGTPVLFSVGVDTAAPTYQWSKDGVDIPGAVGGTHFIPSAQPWHIGDYRVRVTSAAGSIASDVASLGLTGVPSDIWRGLVACYPFDGSPEDLCRAGKPAALLSTTNLVADPERGGVVTIQGKGFGAPPFPGEPVEQQGPGGYMQIPRPTLADGAPFTVSFIIKEEGFSMRHGESFVTMGQGATSVDLIGHYWIGGLDGTPEVYGGNGVAVWPHDSSYVLDGWAVALDIPWTNYSAVAEGDDVRLYRNGEFMGTTPYKKGTVGDFFVGRHWWDHGSTFSTRLLAKVDDLRIYNRALTIAQVQSLYHQSLLTPALHAFESWVSSYELTGTTANPSADPEGDALTNWDEFCFGSSPIEATASSLEAVFSVNSLTLTWLERGGIPYRLTESTDLQFPWGASAAIPTVAADQSGVPPGYTRMTATLSVPLAAAASREERSFFRVESIIGP